MKSEEIEQLLTDCADRESKLSQWEVDFLQSITEQFEEKGGLSKKQYERLSEIWEKVT